MIVRLSSTASRGALVLISLAVAAHLSYFSVRGARASYYSNLETLHGYERATQIEPGKARNWFLLGRYLQYSIEDPDPQRAIASYRRALEIDPRDTTTWLELATTYENEGDQLAARNAYTNAKKTYPASAEVSWRYGNFLLRQGELDSAFAEIRRAVESDATRAAEAFSRCAQVEPDVDKILDRALPARPEIYVAIIDDLAGDRNIDPALKVWNRLATLHPTLAFRDGFQLALALREMNRTQEAHAVWLQAASFAGLGNLPGPPRSAVWDGGFESGVAGAIYAWRFKSNARGVQIGFDTGEKYSGQHSLRLTFDGNSDLDFQDVCEFVAVEAKTAYQLSGFMKPRELTTDQGVRIELRSYSTNVAGASTPDVHGTQPWTRVDTVWNGSPRAEDVEICLRRTASDQEDSKIRGTVWVDDISLTPLFPEGDSRP
jgi:tetratricopeptide (TPR) repeat protein